MTVVRDPCQQESGKGFYRVDTEAKQGNDLIGFDWSPFLGKPSWMLVIGCS